MCKIGIDEQESLNLQDPLIHKYNQEEDLRQSNLYHLTHDIHRIIEKMISLGSKVNEELLVIPVAKIDFTMFLN